MRLFVLDALEHEWPHLGRTSAARSAVRRWADDAPALQQFADAIALVDFVQRRGQPAASDEVLASVVPHAGVDELAARTILQAVLPGLRAVAASEAWRADRDEIDAAVAAEAWTRIRTYPVAARPDRIAANVVLDVRKQVRRSHQPRTREVAAEVVALESRAADEYVAPADEELMSLLVCSVLRGVLTPAEATLIATTTIGGVALGQLVESRSALRSQRRRRMLAEKKLAWVAR